VFPHPYLGPLGVACARRRSLAGAVSPVKA
jgi:hypothetical protein